MSDRARASDQARALGGLALAVLAMAAILVGGLTPFVLTAGRAASSTAARFLDTTCDVRETAPPQASTLLASDGKTVIAKLFTQNRTPVRMSEVPRPLVRALVATEDRRFYEHHGVDLRGLMRAALHDLGGGDTQGGSTLTMQYVKEVRYFQARTAAQREAAVASNLSRKLQNAKCALQIERRFSKQQILQKYLDIAFFGENSYGIATAARTYFNVPVAKLDVPQSAMLVGLLQAPSQYDPFLNPLAARQRRNEVLANMASVGYLRPAAAARYQRAQLTLASKRPPPVPEGCTHANPHILNAGFFCDYTLSWLHEHGFSEQGLDTGGLHIVTTLNATLQTRGQHAIWRAGLKPDADYVLVMPSVDPTNGNVTTMITSRKYGIRGRGESSDPLFTAAFAGAGSTYKYFTAAAALTAGAPTSLKLTTRNNTYRTKHCNTHYRVHNAGNYPDTMPLRDALPQSSNTYFVALEDQFFGCHLGPVVDTAVQLGMDRLRAPLTDNAPTPIAKEVVRSEEPTFTLGQEPTASLELTGAFGAAANGGVLCPPAPVLRVVGPDGHAVDTHRPTCHRVLGPYVARTLVTMMRHDTHDGTASSYFHNWYGHGGSDVAGKTGTDNNAADDANSALWFVGLTPHLVSSASLVNPDNPKQTVHGLPGLPDSFVREDVFGAYASTYWLDAYGSTLRRHWSWPSVAGLRGRHVPRVIGRSRDDATRVLRAAGFRVAVFPVACASDRRAGRVAYQEPAVAPANSVVTICLSSGSRLDVYRPPRVIFVPRRHQPPPPRHHHGGGHGHGQ